MALQSNSASDYIPNLTSAVRQHADLVISAGFLLASATATMAKKFPNTHFAITDYPVEASPFADRKGKVLYPNVEGLTYATNESGCLVGVLAAKTAARMGKKIIGAVGGVQIPPVDIWIAGYRYCAQKAVPGTKVLVGDSQDFVAHRQVQDRGHEPDLAGRTGALPGARRLRPRNAESGRRGEHLGNRRRRRSVRPRQARAYERRQAGRRRRLPSDQTGEAGQFNGGHDLVFNLKNGGMGVGKINPSVAGHRPDEQLQSEDHCRGTQGPDDTMTTGNQRERWLAYCRGFGPPAA